MAILLLTLGTLYGKLFRVDLSTYMPFLASGLVIWSFISQCLSELCLAFIESAHYIKQVKLPLLIYIFRILLRNIIIFMHNMIIVVVTLVIFQVPIEWAQLLIIPAMLLLLANLTWIGVIISVASSRYRDIPQIVTSLLQPIFFLTPIIWTVDFNPIYHLVELVRAPVLGQVPSILTSGVSLGMVIFGWMTAVLLYGKYQYRIAYWVI